MKLSSQVKPIGYLKANASEIVRALGDRHVDAGRVTEGADAIARLRER